MIHQRREETTSHMRAHYVLVDSPSTVSSPPLDDADYRQQSYERARALIAADIARRRARRNTECQHSLHAPLANIRFWDSWDRS